MKNFTTTELSKITDNPNLIKSLSDMCTKLHEIFGDSMDRAVLYGSYARGEQTPESDIDIAILLKNTDDESAHDKMIDVVVDYELELSVTFSVVPIELSQYQEWKKTLPFYKNIDTEGIVLWKTT